MTVFNNPVSTTEISEGFKQATSGEWVNNLAVGVGNRLFKIAKSLKN
ncbi:MAG: hypothetical protein ACQEQP_01635 [Bacillota bacterium]